MPNSSIKLIKNASVYAPEARGIMHLLIAGGKLVYLGEKEPALGDELDLEVVDVDGNAVVPGFIDAHTHITGGGGEAGFATRVPAVPISQFTRAGVTTVVGLLGTDDVVRNTESVIAQVYALREEGLSAYCYTGGYHLPPTTLTGSVRSDIVFIEPIIGVGELAISDHRSSQPTLTELLKVASEAHVARLMTGKAGILHLHLGDGERGLAMVREALNTAEIPARTYNPTHINRRKALFEEACELSKLGCWIDVTAFVTGDVGYEPAEALQRYMQQDLPQDKLTISSDGGGCLPDFDEQGHLTKMDFASSSSMTEVFYQLVSNGIAIDQVLPFFTSNVADLMKFHNKGRLQVGHDADLLMLDNKHRIQSVMAQGEWHLSNYKIVKKVPSKINMPSPDVKGQTRGYVIPIGGAEEKLDNPEILSKFVELAGGTEAVISIIPTASQLADTGERYQQVFKELGAGTTHALPIDERSDTENPALLELLETSTAIFVTGGNQLRLSTILGGTPIAQKIRQLNARGVHYAGTSAGAAIVSQHMIVGGSTGVVPTEGGVNLAPGLGLLNTVVVDQHFNERNRLARLLSAVSYNPFLTGLGLDEDTAAFIDGNNQFTVVGSGAITVIDPSDIEYSSMADAEPGEALTLLNLHLHILAAGSRYDIDKRQAYTD